MNWIKTISRLFLPALVIIICGCEKDKIIFKGPYFVRFTDATGFDKESVTSDINIEVHNAGPALTEDVTISYSIGGTAREGVDYEIIGDPKKVTIAAGEYVGYITIRLINNANNILRSQTVIFTILTTGLNELQVGQGESAIGKSYTFTIFDDCILGGTYNGKQTTGRTVYPDLTIASTDCINYTCSNWNLGVFNTSTAMDLTFVDNGDNTLTIPQQEEENLDASLATIKGTGVVDPTTRQIRFNIILVDFDEQPEVSLTLTPH